ncbi:hypothetical protein LEP1GSC062_1697 [Leptospira alexanderi serovar Manhao 3 str. L 60]|uniref:Uncharacterized protein n=1 Tax=Leptospira alexanderi serovar Manhao 3 str. L 60 TaxID=1049759 RepID=V6IAL9_9LEPT|nr:hypothetical protein LEP1GSC062_1697 [Leptospira alexanderi serovar Manhao 3 str. L 60]
MRFSYSVLKIRFVKRKHRIFFFRNENHIGKEDVKFKNPKIHK